MREPTHTAMRRRLLKLISAGNLMPLIFLLDKSATKYLTRKEWHKSPERHALKMAILCLGAYAGSPPPATLKLDAETRRVLRQHLKDSAKLQAAQKKAIEALLSKAVKK